MKKGQYSTGYELILNASEAVLQIAVTENEQPLCFQEWYLPQKASEVLASSLADICSKLKITSANFRRIACITGPGSFTGIRLLVSTAAALRRASSAQLCALDYMQALATSASVMRDILYPAKIFVLTHAKHNLVHFQTFISFGPQIPAQPITQIELIEPEKAINLFKDEKCFVCGSGILRNKEIFREIIQKRVDAVIMPCLVNPCLTSLCLLARHGDYFPHDLNPKYVRKCDAMENLDKEKKLILNQMLKKEF